MVDNINQKFELAFRKVYGEHTWKDFLCYKKQKRYTEDIRRNIDLSNKQKIQEQLTLYTNRSLNGNLCGKTKNKRFARFLLITVEKMSTYASEDVEYIDFTDANKWHIEHIHAKKDGGSSKLYNLTLLKQELNCHHTYTQAEGFEEKKIAMNNYIVRYSIDIGQNLYINMIFKQDIKDNQLLEKLYERCDDITRIFENIFMRDEITADYWNCVLGLNWTELPD